MELVLPETGGSSASYRLVGAPVQPVPGARFSRIAYAAAHVVADPLAMHDPWSKPVIDWDRTMAFRHHLWRHGFRIAEAMDTSQRGMGFDWQNAKELIRRSIAEAKTVEGADLASGAGTDHLGPGEAKTLDDVIAAYEQQFAFIEGLGGKPIMMASRALAAIARGPEDYARVYDRILSQASGQVILHWLGDMFDPALKGYWGSSHFDAALDTVVAIIERHADKVEGIKISLLDTDKEIALRDRLPEGVLMFTGDDFNYPELIAGDGRRHSHALLGIFDAIAPVGECGAGEARRGRSRRLRRADGADRSAIAQDLRGADRVLQGRHRLHGLAERPPGPFLHGRRHAVGTRHLPLCRDFPPRRSRRIAGRSGTGGGAHEKPVRGGGRLRAPKAVLSAWP